MPVPTPSAMMRTRAERGRGVCRRGEIPVSERERKAAFA
jgi:hypothetical protein